MIDFFELQKPKISSFLADFIEERAAELSRINRWGQDVGQTLGEFVGSGKMIRGGIVILSAMMFRHSDPEKAVAAAAALELIQSAFLIHDDIMDRDETRRGQPAIYVRYASVAQAEGFANSARFGDSMGICAGDISFFLAFEILSSLKSPPSILKKIIALCSREITGTCVAQMQDIYWGYDRGQVDEKEITNLYVHKTGRYTFALPLLIGGLLTEQSKEVLAVLEEIGKRMGTIFQIKDDELDLFGKEDKIGKPAGSDLREGKKTLYSHYLFREASQEQRSKVAGLIGNPNLTTSDLEYIRNLIRNLGIKDKIDTRVSKLANETRELIASLNGVRGEYRQVLLRFLRYNLLRTY